jgi:predicted nucleotidyltransferase
MNVETVLPAQHAAFLDQLVSKVKADQRLTAVLAGGSMAQGGFDELSDLDLVLVVRGDAYAEISAQKRAFAEGLADLLAAFTGEHVGEPRLLICLYGPELLHVDLKFIVSADLDQLVERPIVIWARDRDAVEAQLDEAEISWPERSPEWFEERSWIWLHYAATKLQRGELFEAMGMIAFFREQVLGPMLHRRLNRPQRGVRKIEQTEAAADKLRHVVTDHTRQGVAAALRNAVDLYLELRSDRPPATSTGGMPELLVPFLETRNP